MLTNELTTRLNHLRRVAIETKAHSTLINGLIDLEEQILDETETRQVYIEEMEEMARRSEDSIKTMQIRGHSLVVQYVKSRGGTSWPYDYKWGANMVTRETAASVLASREA